MTNISVDKPISFRKEEKPLGMKDEPQVFDALDCLYLAKELAGRKSLEEQRNDYLFQSINNDWFDFEVIEDTLLTIEKVIRLNRGGKQTSLPWLLPRNADGNVFVDERNAFLAQELEFRGFTVNFVFRHASQVPHYNADLVIAWGQ